MTRERQAEGKAERQQEHVTCVKQHLVLLSCCMCADTRGAAAAASGAAPAPAALLMLRSEPSPSDSSLPNDAVSGL